jgi:uncharacterized protein DUF3618
VAETTRDVRAQIEEARERLAEDVQALAYQANIPKRMRERVSRRLDVDSRRARLREAVWDIRHGDREQGVRKLAAAAKEPVVLAVALVGVGVAVARRGSGSGGSHAASANGSASAGMRGGDALGLVSRPALTAFMHHRQAKKAGRAPGARQFVGYVVVGAATTMLTKWANDRIDRTAPYLPPGR